MNYSGLIPKLIFLYFKLLFIPVILTLLTNNYFQTKNDSNEFKHLRSLWLNWQSWSELCQRNCFEKFGFHFRKRICVNCSKNDCIRVNNSFCSPEVNHSRETQLCYQGN